MHGGYRRQEHVLLNAYFWGSIVLALKQYTPRLIKNMFGAERKEDRLGKWVEQRDNLGNIIYKDTETGEKIPLVIWQAKMMEGKWVSLFKMLRAGLPLLTLNFKEVQKRFKALSPASRANFIDFTVNMAYLGIFTVLGMALFAGADDDDKDKR
jgi:hypothetical protein